MKIRTIVGQEEVDPMVSYIRKRGIIYCVFQTDKSVNGKRITQQVVLKDLETKFFRLHMNLF